MVTFENVPKTLKLQLEPIYLNNPTEKIREYIISKYKNKCFNDIGLINDVINVFQIGPPIISRNNSFPIFTINVSFVSYLPKENEVIDITINTVSEHCIIGDFMEKIVALVTLDNLTNNGYVFKDERYVKKDIKREGDKKGKREVKKIHVGDTLNVKIIKTRYKDENNYMCITELT